MQSTAYFMRKFTAKICSENCENFPMCRSCYLVTDNWQYRKMVFLLSNLLKKPVHCNLSTFLGSLSF